MVDREIEQPVREVEADQDSLLNAARAVWQVRWMVLFFLVAGAVLGVWYDALQPRFRTTTTIRWLSPNISYLNRGYWEIAANIRAGQLRAIIGNHPLSTEVLLLTEKDPWIARLEVLHDNPEQGAVICEEILLALRMLDQRTAAAVQTPAGSPRLLDRLHQTLAELESLLATVPKDTLSALQTVPVDPVMRLNQQFTSEAGPRMPLENLPLFPWYRSLQVDVSRILAAAAATGNPEIASDLIPRLTALQQGSTELLLQYWWSLDLLVSAGPLPGFQIESVAERPLDGLQRQLQSVMLGFWLAAVAATLLAVPWRWLRLHWSEIVRPEVPADR
jgi:hypothetical protein